MSLSGIPISMPMTMLGMSRPKSPIQSKPPEPTSGSMNSQQSWRIWGSSSAMLRGVNIRDSSLRWIVCVGGSSKITVPGGISKPDLSIPRVTPRLEM